MKENIQDYSGQEAIKKIQSMLVNNSTGMLVSALDFDNPSVCPMTVKTIDENGALWFLSDKQSEHFENIQRNGKVLLTFSNTPDNEYLSISGNGEHTDDAEIIDAIWDEEDAQWYENGREDNNIVVLKVSINDAYYWDSEEQKSKSI